MITVGGTVAARCRRFVLLGFSAFVARSAIATPIPAAHFTYDVLGQSTVLGCTSLAGSAKGGTCGTEGSSPGYAATSGGIGTASFLQVTPGGTVLGPGTAVDAMSTWNSGRASYSNAQLTYAFEATGPSNVDFIPIDVLSEGLLDASGNAWAYLALTVTDNGPDDNIPPGVPDPDPHGSLLGLAALCLHGSCVSAWNVNEVTDTLCVVNGDIYTIDIDAVTWAGAGAGNNSASAVLDPQIKVDPPYPTTCTVGADPSALALETGPGASTGYSVPEPSTGDLAALGMLAFGCLGMYRRRTRRVRI